MDVRIVLFCHPEFMRSQSMPRFAAMLQSAFEARGIPVQRWSPQACLRGRIRRGPAAKWAGYADQYLLFPLQVRRQLKRVSDDTLFVFCDQAMGPWVPLIRGRAHVVHTHDLLALRSALGDIPENPTSLTGRIYQRFIRRGVRQAHHFISISHKTRDDLHRFIGPEAITSEVVYNALNYPYSRMSSPAAQQVLRMAGLPIEARGMLLHVGGGQWYKNLRGVIALYSQYAARQSDPLPLWCVCPVPGAPIQEQLRGLPPNARVSFFQGLQARVLQAAYSSARALLFPSLAEGFGWPLIEAAACGCPALTTDEPPMNEIAGPAAVYVPRLQIHDELPEWGLRCTAVLESLLSRGDAERNADAEHAAQWVRRFDPNKSIERYVEIYRTIMELHMRNDASRWPSTTSVQP
jgi:glycosyltransferase involved in cell wall biosynthesis